MGIRVAPSETVPSRVFRHMLPKEEHKFTVRFHPAVLIRPVAGLLGGLALAGVLSATVARTNGYAMLAIWLAFFVLVVWFTVRIYEWLDNYFVVTNKRLILTTGIVTRNVNMMPLNKVTDMSFRRSALGQILGYGEFIVESAGQNQALQRVDHIPYPEQCYLEVCAVLFPEKEEKEDGDE